MTGRPEEYLGVGSDKWDMLHTCLGAYRLRLKVPVWLFHFQGHTLCVPRAHIIIGLNKGQNKLGKTFFYFLRNSLFFQFLKVSGFHKGVVAVSESHWATSEYPFSVAQSIIYCASSVL